MLSFDESFMREMGDESHYTLAGEPERRFFRILDREERHGQIREIRREGFCLFRAWFSDRAASNRHMSNGLLIEVWRDNGKDFVIAPAISRVKPWENVIRHLEGVSDNFVKAVSKAKVDLTDLDSITPHEPKDERGRPKAEKIAARRLTEARRLNRCPAKPTAQTLKKIKREDNGIVTDTYRVKPKAKPKKAVEPLKDTKVEKLKAEAKELAQKYKEYKSPILANRIAKLMRQLRENGTPLSLSELMD